MSDINVKEVLGVQEDYEPLFFKKVGPDPFEAAKRYEETHKVFETWHARINETNTRGLPNDLIQLYEKATMDLCMILAMEKKICRKNGGVL